MNLQTIRLENWKKFTDPVEIQLKEGLNVLYGPNESGKSTLIDSIITTFYSKHTSGAGRVKTLKPWGTSLQPRSQIIFSNNGENYRISKGFQEKKSLLEKQEETSWKKIAEGDRADKELIELIGGQLSNRGDTKPELWGLGQTLWMVQGKPFITDDLNDETLSSLQSMVGATIESEKEKKVLTDIRSRFLDIFTEKTKSLRKGSELVKLKEEISSLNEELLKSHQNKAKKDELIRKIEDNDFLLNRNQKNLQEATRERDNIAMKVKAAREHQKYREQLEREIEGIDSKFETLSKKIEEIIGSKSEISQIQSENDEIKRLTSPLDAELNGLKDKIAGKLTSLEQTNNKIDQTNDEKSIAGIAHTTVMDEQALESLQERFQEISELYHDLDDCREKLTTIIAPSSSQMKKIEKLNKDIDKTLISLQAMGLSLNAAPQVRMSGEISLDNEMTPFSLKENENASWTANQSLRIKIDQVGEFEVTSGSQDVKVMKEELEKMRSEYQETVAPFGTEELNELKALVIKKEAKESEIKRIEAELNKKSDKSKEELQQEIIESRNRIKLKWSKIPDDSDYKACQAKDKTVVRDELSRKIVQLEADIKTLSRDRNKLNQEIEADRVLVQELDKRINSYKTDSHGKSQIIEEINKRLKRLEDDGLTQEDRESQLNHLSVKLDQKKRAWQVYHDEIEEKEEQPLGVFEGLKSKVQRLEEDIQTQKLNNARWDSELQMLISQSTDTNIIEEKLEQLQNKEKELQTEANALKLLFELTTFYRENTIGELSEPIRKQASHDLEKLLGPKYCLKFNKEMKPESIEICGEEAPVDLLSFGTQEQVWCLFRLALGKILSNNEKQLVVLDDPLVNTDPVRMHHALQILEENAKNMQIIVVTCDVDKYNSLKGANFISMDDTV